MTFNIVVLGLGQPQGSGVGKAFVRDELGMRAFEAHLCVVGRGPCIWVSSFLRRVYPDDRNTDNLHDETTKQKQPDHAASRQSRVPNRVDGY